MNTLNQQLKNLETQPIILGSELGKGGEGAVFAIKNSPNLAVKIYHRPPPRDKAEKILAMIRLGNDRLLNLSTWPLASYYSKSGVLSGFVMPRLANYYPLYELYNPKLRLQIFPRADWRFLVHAAMNVARAFKVIHDEGHVVGDVNHGNLVVAKDATVQFIDTDSFQIIDNKKCWFCEVGVSTHQPPEMLGLSTFSGVVRTPNHDNFGLAVLIFQLLFLARHPFSGRFLGNGDMPLEKAIAEYRFAYSSNYQILQMLPPPASLPMIALTPHLRLLFERAFSKEGSGTQVGLRPTPDEWITALTTLATKLKSCLSNGGHYYNQELIACPWCDIEAKSGLTLFPVISVDSPSDLDIATICKRIASIKNSGSESSPPPPLIFHPLPPSSKAKAIMEELKPIKVYSIFIWLLILLGTCALGDSHSLLMILGVITTFTFPYGVIFYYLKRRKKLATTIITDLATFEKNWELLMTKWTSSLVPSLKKIRQNIDDLKKAYDALEKSRQEQIQQVNNKSYQDQMLTHLNSFQLSKANIQGIGMERIKTLRLHSIETASDIEEWRLQGIKGFGIVFCKRLLHWRLQIEQNFVFNPNKCSSAHIHIIDKEIAAKRQKITTELAAAASQLYVFTEQELENRHRLSLEAKELLSQYSQVAADAQEIGL